MAYDARAENEERVIRVWTQAVAHFIQSPITSVSTAVKGYGDYFLNLRTAESENSKLKKEVQELQVEVQKNKELSVENKRLKTLLELKQESTYRILTAQIIGRDTSIWFNAAVVNRGSLDGVKLNMPIVINGGLVGRVTAVSPLTAQFQLITGDKSGLGGIVGEIGSSNALGVIRGAGGRSRLEMSYVPGDITVSVGDSVYTTGQGGVYPAGLKVGEVEEIREGSASVPHQIFIKPSAKISAMQEVAILLFTPQERPKYEDTLPNSVKDEEKVAKDSADSK